MLYESQKNVLITGSAIRIGKFIAESLANDGWNIAIHYHNSEKEAYELAKLLIDKVNVGVFKANLAVIKEAENLIEDINYQMGGLDLIINSASLYKNDVFDDLNIDFLQKNLNIHLLSPLIIAKAFFKQEKSGNIINILDSDINKNMKNFFSYSISKKTLDEITRMLAISMAPNVRVNSIAPGATLFKDGQKKEIFDKHISESPLGIGASLQDIYNTIKFFLNTTSVTGQCIFLDGGKHLK